MKQRLIIQAPKETTINKGFYTFLGSDGDYKFVVTIPQESFERGIKDRVRLVDSVLFVSGLRLNFVQMLCEEEDLVRYPKPIILPKLTKEVTAVDLCVNSYYPVLIAHRVELKCRPLGFMTAKSTLRQVNLIYQQQIVTGLFSNAFILSRREFDLRQKRKREDAIEEARKKKRLAEISENAPISEIEISSSPPVQQVEAITTPLNSSPSKAKPGLVRTSPIKSSVTHSIVKARRNPVHAMPRFTFKRIKVKVPEIQKRGSRKPVILPVYSMLSSSDSDDDLPVNKIQDDTFKSTTEDTSSPVDAGAESDESLTILDHPPDVFGDIDDGVQYEAASNNQASTSKLLNPSIDERLNKPEKASSFDIVATELDNCAPHNSLKGQLINISSTPNKYVSDLPEISSNFELAPPLHQSTQANSTPAFKPLRSGILSDGTCIPTTPTQASPQPSTSKSTQSFNSFTAFFSDARKLPEKLLGRLWTQSPSPAEAEANESTSLFLENPLSGPSQPSNSLSQFLTNLYKRDDLT